MGENNILQQIIMRKHYQNKNAKLLQINAPNSIVESSFVKIGGIDQWITIRGENRNNPILLLIHGGPASTYSIFNPLLRSWEKHFTVVQWDQRGTGKTFGKNGKDGCGTITFERLAKDGIEVTEYLIAKLGQPKVVLIGSSAGSLIGIMMAKLRPELFHAYVGTDQNAPDSQNLLHKITINAVHASGNTKGVQLLEKMGANRSQISRKDVDKRNRILVKAIRDVPNMITDIILPSMISSPEHKIRDIMDIFKGMSYSLDHLYTELINFDFKKIGMIFELPVFIIHGDNDIITPTQLAKLYFNEIEAPYKEFVLIKNAGHLACFARADQFLEELLMRVRPLAAPTSN